MKHVAVLPNVYINIISFVIWLLLLHAMPIDIFYCFFLLLEITFRKLFHNQGKQRWDVNFVTPDYEWIEAPRILPDVPNE